MDNLSRKWIGISFSGEKKDVTPFICRDGTKGLKKVIQNVQNLTVIAIMEIDFDTKSIEILKEITLPELGHPFDLKLTYKLEEQNGELSITNTDYKWKYSGMKEPACRRVRQEPAVDMKERVLQAKARFLADKASLTLLNQEEGDLHDMLTQIETVLKHAEELLEYMEAEKRGEMCEIEEEILSGNHNIK